MFKYYELYIMGRTEEIDRERAAAIVGERDLAMMEDYAQIDYSGEYVDASAGIVVEFVGKE